MRKITLCLIYEWFNEDFASKRQQHQHYVCSTYSDKVWCFSFLLHSHRLLHASRLFHQDSQSSKCAAFFSSFTELDCRVLAIQFIVPMYFNEIFIQFLMCIISEDQKDELTTIKFIKFSLGCKVFFFFSFWFFGLFHNQLWERKKIIRLAVLPFGPINEDFCVCTHINFANDYNQKLRNYILMTNNDTS